MLSGMSTALLLQLDLEQQQLCIYSIGDCSALVLRENARGGLDVAGVSRVKYHDNGAPYQLAGRNWTSDSVDDGRAEMFAVAAGDVIFGFSDGATGNIEFGDVAKVVTRCAGHSADAIAQAVVDQAHAAGRVADDITVVVVRLGSCGDADVAELRAGPRYPIDDEPNDSASLVIGAKAPTAVTDGRQVAPADRVRVVKGPLDGKAATVVRVREDSQVIVRLDGAEKLLVLPPERLVGGWSPRTRDSQSPS